MHTIQVTWRGGPSWNPDESSLFDPNKPMSTVEHLIHTGGQTIEETVEAIGHFRSKPIMVTQEKGTDDGINWITTLCICGADPEENLTIQADLLAFYQKKQADLENISSEYQIEIKVLD